MLRNINDHLAYCASKVALIPRKLLQELADQFTDLNKKAFEKKQDELKEYNQQLFELAKVQDERIIVILMTSAKNKRWEALVAEEGKARAKIQKEEDYRRFEKESHLDEHARLSDLQQKELEERRHLHKLLEFCQEYIELFRKAHQALEKLTVEFVKWQEEVYKPELKKLGNIAIAKISAMDPESIIGAFIADHIAKLDSEIQSPAIAADKKEELIAKKSALEDWMNPKSEQTLIRKEKVKAAWEDATQRMLPVFSEAKESRHELLLDSRGPAYQDIHSEARSEEKLTPSEAFARVADVAEQSRRFENTAVMANLVQHYFAEYDRVLKPERGMATLTNLLGVSHERLAAQFVKHPRIAAVLDEYQQGLHTVQQQFDQKSQEIMELRQQKMQLLDKMLAEAQGMSLIPKPELAARMLKEIKTQGLLEAKIATPEVVNDRRLRF